MAHAWLWRLEATQWLAAARRELELGRGSIDLRRRAITHARRGAGMALNGVLVVMRERGWSEARCESAWGRSYLEHLRALAQAEETEPLPAAVGELASELLRISVMPGTGLVTLRARSGSGGAHALETASRLVEACAAVIGT